jgi:thiamine biosynthesis lipoprotein
MGEKKVSHLIDPKSGYPLDNSLISVTIYAPDAITADGYDNAVMAMSVEEALAFVASKKEMEAYIIYHRKDGSVADTLTKGFKKLMIN